MNEQVTHIKKLFNPDYIGAYSLQPGEDRVVEIVEVKSQVITGDGGKKSTKAVATLKNEKPFIINATNRNTLIKLFGTPYIEHWKGKKFTLYAEVIKDRATGDDIEALRVRPSLITLPILTPDHKKWDEALQAIIDGKTTLEKIRTRYHVSDEHAELLKGAHL